MIIVVLKGGCPSISFKYSRLLTNNLYLREKAEREMEKALKMQEPKHMKTVLKLLVCIYYCNKMPFGI